jgi:hypothetical protein
LFAYFLETIIKEPFKVIENYISILNLEDIKNVSHVIIFIHLGKFISDYIYNKKYLKFTTKEIVFKPYVRILYNCLL